VRNFFSDPLSCSIDFVETAIFDPGVTVSSPVVSVSFAVEVKGVEIAVASSVAADVTVFSSGGFVVTDNEGEECDVEDKVTAITVDDLVKLSLIAVVIDDVGTIGVDGVADDVVGAVDDVEVVVVDDVDDDVARVSTGAAEDAIIVEESDEAVGEGVTSMSPGIGQ